MLLWFVSICHNIFSFWGCVKMSKQNKKVVKLEGIANLSHSDASRFIITVLFLQLTFIPKAYYEMSNFQSLKIFDFTLVEYDKVRKFQMSSNYILIEVQIIHNHP